MIVRPKRNKKRTYTAKPSGARARSIWTWGEAHLGELSSMTHYVQQFHLSLKHFWVFQLKDGTRREVEAADIHRPEQSSRL